MTPRKNPISLRLKLLLVGFVLSLIVSASWFSDSAQISNPTHAPVIDQKDVRAAEIQSPSQRLEMRRLSRPRTRPEELTKVASDMAYLPAPYQDTEGRIHLTAEQNEILRSGRGWKNSRPEKQAILDSIPSEAFRDDW